MSQSPILPPVAKSLDNLAPRLCSLFAQTLEPLGFTPKSNYRLFYYWTRRTETLEQRCGLTFTDYSVETWFDYRFTSSPAFWAPTNDELARRTVERFEAENRKFARRRRSFGVEGDPIVAQHSYSSYLDETKGAEDAFARSQIGPFLTLAVDALENRREALDILRDFDAGAFDATSSFYSLPRLVWDGGPYFGLDPVHIAFNLGGLRLQTGQNAEALAQFAALASFLRDLSSPDAKFAYPHLFDCSNVAATPFAPSYWNAAFELALLGVDVAKRRIAADGPGPSAPTRPQTIPPSSFTKSRRFKRPAFSAPGLDETLVFNLLRTARFSDDETQAAEATRRLEELANRSPAVVYESPDECRLAANDAKSPISFPESSLDDAKSPPAPARSRSRRRQVAPPVPVDPADLTNEQTALDALKKDLTRRLQEVFAQRLEPLGFKKKSAQSWTQTTQTLSRCCRFGFQSPYSLFVAFEHQVLPQFDCWANAPQDAESQELIERFRKEKPEFRATSRWYEFDRIRDAGYNSAFYSDYETWVYPPQDGEIEPLIVKADTFLAVELVPFFERFPEIDDLLREYDAGRLPQKFALGRSVGPSREFYAAQARFRAGQYAESLACFEAVPELLRLFDETPPDAPTQLLLEVARLGALSVRQTIAERGPGPATPPRRPLPEPLATALPRHPDYQRRNILRTQELANSLFEPETTRPRRVLDEGAERLRRLQEKSAQILEPLGFTRTSPISWTRETATIRQTFDLRAFDFVSLDFSSRLKLDLSPWDDAPQDDETQEVMERWRAFAAKRWPDGAFPYFADGYWRDALSPCPGLPSLKPARDVVVRVTREQMREDARRSRLPMKASPPSLDQILNNVEQGFTQTVLPFFDYWTSSRAALDAPRETWLKSSFSIFVDPGIDDVEDKLCSAIALFQVGRYTESAKKFDVLSKLKKSRNVTWRRKQYDDADWATLQDAARIAAASVRQLAKERKTKR